MVASSARSFLAVVAILLGGVTFNACSNSTPGRATGDASRDSSGDVGTPGSGGTGVVCKVADDPCTSNGQCCSNICDPVSSKCKSSVTTCSGQGSSCKVATDCCNLQCDTVRGVCSTAASCTADNQACTTSAECCGQNCTGQKCVPLNTACLTAGNPCTASGAPGDGGAGARCCSGLCANNKCVLGASFCIQPGDACSRDTDCCGGWCAKAQGATLGVCQDVQTTGAGSCTHDGVLCNGCGSCCSRNCGPWALTGVNVCQPGLGCKILNSLCTTDQECCGGDTGNVTCVPGTGPQGITIGVCTQNHSLQVAGGICGLSGANACGNSQHDCDCPVDPKIQCCSFDTLGLPRCLGFGQCGDGGTGIFKGTDPACCRQGGQTCNTASECCNLSPCVPDSTGTLRCLGTPPTDGGIVCLPSGGRCTATGDCCTGLVCNITPGAPSGTCGNAPTPTDGGTPNCALYGQGCNGVVTCCNNVPCTYSADGTACNGRTGCTCFSPTVIP
jgi:hypothetical protein